MRVAFANIFSAKALAYNQSFNDTLISLVNDIVSFEQLGPDF